MIEKIEVDLKRAAMTRDRAAGEPSRGHVERHVPLMIHPRDEGHSDLAHDL
jgi:hypothetical protein